MNAAVQSKVIPLGLLSCLIIISSPSDARLLMLDCHCTMLHEGIELKMHETGTCSPALATKYLCITHQWIDIRWIMTI